VSYALPTECSYPKLCKPNGEYGPSLVRLEREGPFTRSHNISTAYHLTIAGNLIKIIDTQRLFSFYYQTDYGQPNSLIAYRQSWGTSWIWCEELIDNWKSRIKEDCTIIKSTIHYLDLRYGVCLYKEVTQKIAFDVIGRTTPTRFKLQFGDYSYHKALMKRQDLIGSIEERWFFIRNGIKTLLSEVVQPWIPYFQISGGKIWSDTFTPDPNVVQGFVFPQPPSVGICIEDEISYYGFYDYGNDGTGPSALLEADGGCGDYYYPDWCRQMQEDALWKDAAKRRFLMSWYKEPAIENKTDYTPPPITVDPLPRGTFIKHPVVGEVWQFLVEKRDGTTHLETNPDFDAIVLASLVANGVSPKQGSMLYYPIGVI
jgi:hypothetical protein